jgi:hypothetical protein
VPISGLQKGRTEFEKVDAVRKLRNADRAGNWRRSSPATNVRRRCPLRRSCAIADDYSVPAAYGFRDVLEKGFVDQVAIIRGADEIARHFRIYGRGQFVFDPKHYLALLEQKPGALDQAAPLQSWTLPESLQHLRRLSESRMGNRGKREFIEVLRLMEIFPESIVAAATTDAIHLGAISFDAVKQLVIAKGERRPALSTSTTIHIGRWPNQPFRHGSGAHPTAGWPGYLAL